MDHGERLAPVALAAEEPVAQLVLRLGLAHALLHEPVDHLHARLVHGEARDEARGHHHTRRDVRERGVARVGDGIRRSRLRRVGVGRRHDLHDWEVEHLREVEVTLIMRGHGHDRARAVGSEHVVGDEDRQLLAVHGVDPEHALELHAGRLLVELRALEVALRGGLRLVGLHGVGVCDLPLGEPLRHEAVLGREHHVGGAEERVAAGGVDGDLLGGGSAAAQDAEIHQRARGLADPVALHLLDALGPVERVEPREQALRVGGDLQHPLAHRTADHGVVAAFGASVDHFLVRKHRAERGAPVHRHLRHVGESLLVELLEDPLRPLVVLRVGGVHLAVPVVRETEGADLLAEAVHVLLRGDRGVRARLHGVLLGGEAKGVPAHRVQHVEALHALVAAEDVGRRIAFRMAHVQARAARVWEHVETVELLFALDVVRRFERLVLQPELLPFLLDFSIVVFGHFRFPF